MGATTRLFSKEPLVKEVCQCTTSLPQFSNGTEIGILAIAPRSPGPNGQGHTKEECLDSLADAISLILEDRREDALRGVPQDAIREVITIK